MFYQILILFIGHFSFDYARTKEIRPYFCDNQTKIDEIVNIHENLKRFIRYKNEIYFVLKNRIIYTGLFLDKDQFVGFELLVNFSFYQQETVEVNSPELIPDNYTVLGHIFDESKEEVVEYYSTNNATYKLSLYERAYLLNFDRSSNRSLAERIVSEKKYDLVGSNNLKLDKKNAYIDFLFGVDGRIFCESFTDQNQSRTTEKDDQFLDLYIESSIVKGSFNISRHMQTIKYFTFFAKKSTIFKNFTILFTQIIEMIPNSEFAIYFATFIISNNESSNGRPVYKFLFDFDEFFSCHTRFKNDRQVRGIFFNRENQLIFIFIKRFYLKLNSTKLIDNGFYLKENYFLNNAIPIQFEKNEQIYFTGESETTYRKWLKMDKQKKTLFTPEERHLFEINSNPDSGDLNFKRTDAFSSELKRCKKQTLVIENVIFCFEEENYFRTDPFGIKESPTVKIIKIKTIFKNTPINWPDSELQFIFNYVDNKFIMMTKLSIFIFEYHKFYFTQDTLECAYTANDKFEQKVNHFYDDKFERTSTPKLQNVYKVLEHFNEIAIGFILVSVSIIILILFFAVYKKRIKEKSKTISSFISFNRYAKATKLVSDTSRSLNLNTKLISESNENPKFKLIKKIKKISNSIMPKNFEFSNLLTSYKNRSVQI